MVRWGALSCIEEAIGNDVGSSICNFDPKGETGTIVDLY